MDCGVTRRAGLRSNAAGVVIRRGRQRTERVAGFARSVPVIECCPSDLDKLVGYGTVKLSLGVDKCFRIRGKSADGERVKDRGARNVAELVVIVSRDGDRERRLGNLIRREISHV